MVSRAARNLIGQTVGQFEIKDVVGGGGMGTVYRAVQVGIGREVAVKVLNADLTDSEQFIARFEREAQTIASLEHAHIIPLYSYGKHETYIYLVMPLKTGGNLGKLIQETKGRMPIPEVSRIINQISSALDHAHLKGIIHRDLKPANILLDEGNNVFLTDFGIARRLGETKLTAPGTVVGSPTYMSPEAWRGEDPSPETDVYSLGVILFELLTGQPPFVEKVPTRLMMMHLNDAPPSLLAFRPDLPSEFEVVFQRALSKERQDRFHSAGEFAQWVKAAASRPKGKTAPLQQASGDVESTTILNRPTIPDRTPDMRDAVVNAQSPQKRAPTPLPDTPMPRRESVPQAMPQRQPTPLGGQPLSHPASQGDNTRTILIVMGGVIVLLMLVLIVLIITR
ncbi:MAG: hypothetical protein OHK0023_19750 [Anaerolineae bacterium]